MGLSPASRPARTPSGSFNLFAAAVSQLCFRGRKKTVVLIYGAVAQSYVLSNVEAFSSMSLLTAFAPGRQSIRRSVLRFSCLGFSDADILPIRSLIICSKIVVVFSAVDDSGKCSVSSMPFRDTAMESVPARTCWGCARTAEPRNWAAAKTGATGRSVVARHRTHQWTFVRSKFKCESTSNCPGAICRMYLVNFYGASSSHLHGGLPTDRLVAEWHLNSARVRSRLGATPSPATYPEDMPSLEIPLNIQDLKLAQPETVVEIQLRLRERMMELFQRNFYISRLAIDAAHQKATYLFQSFEQTNPVS